REPPGDRHDDRAARHRESAPAEVASDCRGRRTGIGRDGRIGPRTDIDQRDSSRAGCRARRTASFRLPDLSWILRGAVAERGKVGLGTRYRREGTEGPFEVLVLRDTFATIPSFEFLLRERLNRLAHVRSESIARVYDVEHVPEGAKLAIISKAVAGVRLSRMLA